MSRITERIPGKEPYSYLEIEAEHAVEFISLREEVLQSHPWFQDAKTAPKIFSPSEAPDASNTPLEEGEALEALKTALGASEGPTEASQPQDRVSVARAEFLAKFNQKES